MQITGYLSDIVYRDKIYINGVIVVEISINLSYSQSNSRIGMLVHCYYGVKSTIYYHFIVNKWTYYAPTDAAIS